MSKNELKRQLKVLKSRLPNPEEEIKHVSHILRKKFRKKKRSVKITITNQTITKIFGNTTKKF